jgi:maltose alpha-D-glucosyltransferase/alpha-amylase
MGTRIAEMHLLFAQPTTNPAFSPEPFNDFYRQSLYHGYIALTGRRLEFLRQRYGSMNEDVRPLAAKVLEQENAILDKFRAVFEQRIPSVRTRFHGRLHLAHILITPGHDVSIFDFEGDPDQHLSERRIKRCPLRDVASMLLSFGYAATSAIRQFSSSEQDGSATRDVLRVWARFWYSHVSAAFLRAYWTAAESAPYMPPASEQQQTLLESYLMERALLDVRADIQDKPELSGMPLRVILHLLDAEAERHLGE